MDFLRLKIKATWNLQRKSRGRIEKNWRERKVCAYDPNVLHLRMEFLNNKKGKKKERKERCKRIHGNCEQAGFGWWVSVVVQSRRERQKGFHGD